MVMVHFAGGTVRPSPPVTRHLTLSIVRSTTASASKSGRHAQGSPAYMRWAPLYSAPEDSSR